MMDFVYQSMNNRIDINGISVDLHTQINLKDQPVYNQYQSR